MEATPGTAPDTLNCRKIKSTFKSVYTKCCQKIKTKNLLETHSKYSSAAASVPLTLLCSLTGMCSSKTQFEAGAASAEVSKFILYFTLFL